jgi:hypothetical protein
MCNAMSLKEAIKKAKGIKRTGVKLFVELSGSLEDPINRTMKKSNELLRKLDA